MLGTVRVSGASAQLIRHTYGLNRSQWRSVQRQFHRQLSQHSGRAPLIQISRRWQSNTTDAAKAATSGNAKEAENVAKELLNEASHDSVKETANYSVKDTAKDAAKDAAKATAEIKANETVDAAENKAVKTAEAADIKAKEAAQTAEDKARETANATEVKARETAKAAEDQAKTTANVTEDKVKEAAKTAEANAKDAAKVAGDQAKVTGDKVKETANKAEANAKETAKAAEEKAKDTAKATAAQAQATASSAAQGAKRGGSRLVAYIYGTGLVLLLSFGYLYITDTRASVHQYLVVPLVRLIHSDPEEAHHAGVRYIKALYDFGLHPRERGNQDQKLGDLKIEVFGHVLDNPIGTSAGIDKNAEIPDALMALGPALVEVGGATPLPQEGNPKPRVFRLPSQNALINRYGLNSDGAEHVAMQLRERVRQFAYDYGMGLAPESERLVLDSEAGVPPGSLVPGKILAVQVAKNKATPDNDIAAVARDYVFCVDHLAKYADVLVVNVSSPNTPGLRDLQATAPLTAILTAVVDAARTVNRKTKPAVMVKVSPDEDSDSQIEGICTAVWASGVDGVIVGNTTKKRPDPLPKGYIMPADETKLLTEVGGYSGPQMFERTLDLVKRYRNKLDQGPQDEAPAISAQAPPVDDTKSRTSVAESIERDAKRLKPETPEAEKESKQPLVQLPDRHSSENTAERVKSIGEAAKTDAPLSASSPQTPPAVAEGEKVSIRDAAQGALQKIITGDSAQPPSPSDSTSSVAPASPSNTQNPIDPRSKVIFATGGITNGEQCLQILNAGASICQVYTAMMYGGIGTVTRMKSEMREAMNKPKGR